MSHEPNGPRQGPVTTISGLPPSVIVDTRENFADLLEVLKGEPALALDTESDSLYRYFYKVCLIQISTRETDYLVDPLRIPDLTELGPVLANPQIEKVFHAAENDILMLKRDFGFSFANIFDTMLAARILGRKQVGLAALLAEHFDVKLDKRTQLTDWGRRPLTREQTSYARFDSRYLLPLRDLLAEQLRERDRWREAAESFALLPALTPTDRQFDPEGFWRMKDARTLSHQELAVLRELYLWRDEQARAADLPPFKVIDDRGLVLLSRTQPREMSELRLGDWQKRRYGRQMLEAIARGLRAPVPQPPARPHNNGFRQDAAVVSRFDRLRAWRTQVAEERGVESDVVLTNEILMGIARADPQNLDELVALGLLGEWKFETYGQELLRALRG